MPDLPAVMRVGAVRLRHPLDVLLLLDCAAATGGRVEKLSGHALDGRALRPRVARGDQPPQAQRLRPARVHFHRHLVGRPADAAATDLDARLDVVERLTVDLERLLTAALLDEPARTVEDAAGQVLLAVTHELVDQGRDRRVGVHEVGLQLADFGAPSASHRLLRPTLRLLGAVLAAALVALHVAPHADALRIERAADDVIPNPRQVLHTTPADEHHRVLLEVVLLARDVGGDFLSAGEPHARDLAQRRVRLLRRLGLDGGADATALGRTLERGRLALLGDLSAPLAEQLIDGRQNDHSLVWSRARWHGALQASNLRSLGSFATVTTAHD